MSTFRKSQGRFPWIEASLRFAGRFGTAEKKTYRHRFDLTDGMISRDQDDFLRLFNQRCGSDVVTKSHGRLRLTDASALPMEPVFPPLPKMTDWMEIALGSRFEMVSPIRRAEPSHAILREVVQAIFENRPIRFRYQPRRGAAHVRLVSPHTVVHIVGRLHLRGWDHERNEPRDLVLSRITTMGQKVECQGFVGQMHDREWTEQVSLEVRLRDSEELQAVRPDYYLDEFGRCTRQVRKAHASYLVGPMTADDRVLQAPVTIRLLESSQINGRPLGQQE